MRQETLSLLRSPDNHEPLELRDTEDGQVLVGKESGRIFRIREGIPILMDESRLSEQNRRSRIYYDILAPFYRFTQSLYYVLKGGEEKSRVEYLNFLDAGDGDRVLEVSVGNGVNAPFFPGKSEYYGIDVSWGQLKRCREIESRYGRHLEVFQAEAEHLPFCDGAFDIVFNVASINYFEDKKKAIDEMFRVAKPGARMMIADETEKAAHAHNRLPLYRGYFNNSKGPVVPPIDLLPGNAADVKLTEIRNGLYFVLAFTKKPEEASRK